MDAQNQSQVPLAAQGTRKHSQRRFIIAAILIAALIIAIVLALSSLGIIPGYLAIIITAFAIVFGAVFTLLPLISTGDKPVTPVSSLPQYVIPEIKPEINIEVHTPVPFVMPAPPAQQETSPPASAWNVPYLRNPFFTGREELLKQLHDNLTQNKAAALTQAQAIHGLGGIGKTQTAVEYAYRYRDEYQYVLWANAATRDELITSTAARK